MLRGCAVQNSGAINHNVAAFSAGSLTIQAVNLLTATQIPYGLVFAGPNGNVTVLDGCNMAGGAAWMWYVLGPGAITMGGTVNVASVQFTIATIGVSGPGFVTRSLPNYSFNPAGTVIGNKYALVGNGTIFFSDPSGSSQTFIPGNKAGVNDGTGSYS